MTSELIHLGPSPQATLAAVGLAGSRHVHLRLASAAETPPEGFFCAPAALAFWTATATPPPQAVETQFDELAALGVEFCLYDVASFGSERLIQEVYFPLIVRYSYCTGTAPFPVNLDNFRLLADPDAFLAIAVLQGTVVGAALLRQAVPGDAPHHAAPAALDGSRTVELVAIGVQPVLADTDASFFFSVLAMLAAHDCQWVWIRERPWVTEHRATAFTARAQRADHIAYLPGINDCYAWNASLLAANESILFLESRESKSKLVCHVVGRASRPIHQARQALSSRGVESSE